MQLESLEINGFKSFAKKVEFDFDAPITAIVGPNGSGKSNAVEAFRFVLGEQSMKSMRSSQGEDLLFNGSRAVSRSNRASVKATFDNADRTLDIDFDTVTIKRVVHRDSANEYHLNGSEVRLKDISELLAKANIGSSGHHIISQGEADRILNVNTHERKEMIEDALGLKVYHYKIEEAQKKLKKTKSNLTDIKRMHRKLQPRLNALEKKKEKIKKAEDLRTKLTRRLKEYFKRESIYLTYAKKAIEEKLAEPKEALENLREEKEEIRKHMKEADTNTDEHKEKKKTLSKLKDTRRSLRNKKDELSRKVGQIEGEIASEKRALKREKQRSEDGVSILLATVESFLDDIHNSLRNAIQSGSFDETKKVFKTIQSNLDAFIKKHKEKEEEKQSKESIKASLQDLKDTLQTITSTQETTQKEIKTVSEKIQSINHKIKQEESTKQEAEKRLLEIKAKESDIRSTVNSLESQKEQVEQARSQFKEDLGEAGVNVNKSATEYEDVTLRNEDGEPIRKKQILNEARSKQQNRRTELKQMQAKLENLSVDTSNDVLSQYENVKNRNDFLENEIDDLESSKQRLNDVINKLETTLAEKFKDGINAINEQFEHFFGVMFGGGEAQIEVVKKDAPRSDQKYKQGVAIDVHLPYKRINSIEMLSGGERALTSIALLFAITQINPPPFLVLDEMDAALDEANSRKYGDLIENLSEHSQLVLITHNRETMSRADHLYGITMGGDGVSQLLSVEFSEAVQVAKE